MTANPSWRPVRQSPGQVCRLATLIVLVTVRSLGAQEPLVLPVWPGAVAGDFGTIGPERVRAPSGAPTKDAKWFTNVTKPTLTVFRPAKDKNTGTAILICPGGGYWNLAWDLEGEEVAARLNTIGVTGIVLKVSPVRTNPSGCPLRVLCWMRNLRSA